MIKNFRMQMIPLAQTPTVSNVRRLRYQFSSHVPTTIADYSPGSARNRAAPQEYPQNLHTLNWLDTTLSQSAQIHLSHTPCSSQSGTTKDASILGILDEPLMSMNDRNNYPISEALTEISDPYSEPYWLARSDRASPYTTQSDIGMFKRLASALATSITSFCPAYTPSTLPDFNHPSFEQYHNTSALSERKSLLVETPLSATSANSTKSRVTCQACSLQFSGTPQDAMSNLHRHLRTSPRHIKDAGFKCPMSGCENKKPLRSGDLGSHLQNSHRITAKSERHSSINPTRLLVGTLDSNGRPRRRSKLKSETDSSTVNLLYEVSA